MSTAARIEELRKKFEENPRRYFAPLANELRKAGDVAQAIALCREFLPKQPGHMSGFIVFGQSLYEAGELEEARTVFEQALSLDPENLIALRHLGDIARASGDAAGARRWYERVLDADPRNDDIAAQLSTLAALRPQTPAKPQAETFESVAARMSETPPIGMGSIGFTVMPTPDSAMRAIDLEGLESRFREQSPIDLDAVEESATSAASVTDDAPQGAWSDERASGERAPEVDVPAFDVPDLNIDEAYASQGESPAPLDVPDLSESFQNETSFAGDEDPFAFPAAAEPTEVEVSAESAAPSSEEATVIDADFEEGLIAENWPDTSELESRVLTPRSVTPASVTPLSSVALDDAIAAFGREREQPAAFDDRADDLEPTVESLEAPHVEPLAAFEATSIELEAPVSFGDIEGNITPENITGENVTLDAPVTFDAITDEMAVPPALESAGDDFAATTSFESVTDEMPVPTSFVYAGDDLVADDAVDEHGLAPEAVDERFVGDDDAHVGEVVAEAVVADAVDVDEALAEEGVAEEPVAAEAVAEEAVAEEAVAEEVIADAVVGSNVESAAESIAETSELPWIAVSDSTSEMLEANDEADPGLEEIAGVFADDARSAGDQGAVTVAALEDPIPSGETESFADVAQAMDEEATAAFAVVDESAGTPATGSPAFVTETMGELLVAQGFVPRAVEVYEELVRRRPYDPVLSSRLDELRAMMSPAPEQEGDDAVIEAEAASAPAASFEMFPPAMADEFDVSSPTPAYGTPVSATPVMGVSAVSGHSYQTPAQATPAFTPPRVTPVAPYAQPAAVEEFAPRRSAGEWFASLAARRVPRRTPAQSAPAVESTPEGLASLFGDAGAGDDDDAAARALADAFAPLSEQDLASGSVLDFDFARETPAFSPAVNAPVSASAATPSGASASARFASEATPPASPAGGGNAGFAFDKFFPDPATRRPTPAAPSANVGNAPVSDDLAQFSAWLKGLGNP